MRYILLLSLAVVLMAFGSSKPRTRIKTITAHLSGNVSAYRYTPDGLVAAVSSSKGNSATYRYEADLIIKETTNRKTNAVTIDTFWLDSRGMAVNYVMHSSIRAYYTAQYDANNHLTRLSISQRDVKAAGYEYDYEAGDLVSFRFMDDKDAVISRESYSYYTDIPNTIDNEQMGMGFMGYGAAHAISAADETTISGQKNYRYHLDAAGRISIKATYNGKGRLLDSVSYTYY
jgi:hypothetical protein